MDGEEQTEIAYTNGKEEKAKKSLVCDAVSSAKGICEGKTQN